MNQVIISDSSPLLSVVKGGFASSDAGVENNRLPCTIDRAGPRPNGLLAFIIRRGQRDRQMFPFHQVATPHMTPILWTVFVTEWVELVEEMVVTFVEYR